MDWLTERGLEELAYEEYQRNLRKYNLEIEDIYITYPFKTLLPDCTDINLDKIISRTLNEDQKIYYNELDEYYELNIQQAISIAIHLIGFAILGGKTNFDYINKIRDKFSYSYLSEKFSPKSNVIYRFKLSSYIQPKPDIKPSNIPLIKLLNNYPELILNDSCVQIAIGLLRHMYVWEKESFTKISKDILEQGKIKLLKPSKNPEHFTGDRRLKQFRIFKHRPELLYILVQLYEQIIEDIFKNQNRQKYGERNKDVLKDLYWKIYRSDMPDDLFNRYAHIRGKTDIALHLIAHEIADIDDNEQIHFMGLRRFYMKLKSNDSKLFNNSTLNELQKIINARPYLSIWISNIESEIISAK